MQLTAKDIADRLSSKRKATRALNGNWMTNCPCSIHKNGDKNPSLALANKDGKLFWKCYSGGDQAEVWAAICERIPELKDANAYKQNLVATPYKAVVDKTRSSVYNRAPVDPPAPASLPVYTYMDLRGISAETVDALKIGWLPATERIAFSYYVDGILQHIKALDPKAAKGDKNRWWQTPGGGKCYYNLDAIDPTKPIIVCEGEMDAVSITHAGEYNVVSVPNGASFSKETHPEYIAGSWELFAKAPQIILATDNDAPGLGLRESLAKVYGRDRCWLVDWVDGCKDANEVLTQHGPDAVLECIRSARPYPIRALQSAAQYKDSVFELYYNGKQRGLHTGYDSVSQYYSVMPGELEIVTGIPSSGKTNWVDQVNVNLSERYGTKHAVCSFENPMEQHLSILAEKRARKSFVGHGETRISAEELSKALDWIDKYFVFIRFDDDTAPTVDAIIEHAKAAKIRYGIETLTVDPWNYIEQSRRGGQSETEYISEVLSKLRIFAQNHEVHVKLVAHPPKLQKDKDGVINPPTGYEISGSANFYNKADVLTVVHRNPTVNPQMVDIIWRKVRFKMTGQPGQVAMRYNLATGCYEEID